MVKKGDLVEFNNTLYYVGDEQWGIGRPNGRRYLIPVVFDEDYNEFRGIGDPIVVQNDDHRLTDQYKLKTIVLNGMIKDAKRLEKAAEEKAAEEKAAEENAAEKKHYQSTKPGHQALRIQGVLKNVSDFLGDKHKGGKKSKRATRKIRKKTRKTYKKNI
jgi:hypothetical protein